MVISVAMLKRGTIRKVTRSGPVWSPKSRGRCAAAEGLSEVRIFDMWARYQSKYW